jgi:hypothetical protein
MAKPKGHKRGCACVVCGRGKKKRAAKKRTVRSKRTRARLNPKGHKRGCACVVCGHKRKRSSARPRAKRSSAVAKTAYNFSGGVRGKYAARTRAKLPVRAHVVLNEREAAAWRRGAAGALRKRVVSTARRVHGLVVVEDTRGRRVAVMGPFEGR